MLYRCNNNIGSTYGHSLRLKRSQNPRKWIVVPISSSCFGFWIEVEDSLFLFRSLQAFRALHIQDRGIKQIYFRKCKENLTIPE